MFVPNDEVVMSLGQLIDGYFVGWKIIANKGLVNVFEYILDIGRQ